MKANAMTAPTRNQAGFSLLELMVAMVVTLIVTGAIYGLLAGGQSAFRREPQLTERQQNTRIAMSLLEQDIGAAGVGLPAFAQVFTPGLDGGGGPDAIEIVVGLPACPLTELCVRQPDVGNTIVVETKIDVSACAGVTALGGPGLGALRFGGANPNQAIIGVVTNLGNPGNACAAAGSAGNAFGVTLSLDFAAGPALWRPFGVAGPVPAAFAGPAGGVTGFFVPVQVVRYIVATDPNDASNPGDPNFLHLWRSVTGGRSAGDNWAAPQPAPGPEWQLVARGINDLQVTYVDGTAQLDEPQPIDALASWSQMVRQVNVTLSSRVAGMNIAGFTGQDETDPTQIRLGQLTSQVAPRAALLALQDTASGAFQWK